MQQMSEIPGLPPMPVGGNEHTEGSMSGGRRRRRGSRSRKGRKGRKGKGGYLMDVAVAAGLLGATQLGKQRYGYNGPTRRRSRRSRRSSRSRSRR
jgi:hypothetical protein